jgi:outer membrane biosynthesis protein TonB
MAGLTKRRSDTVRHAARFFAVVALLSLAGCKSTSPAVNDATLTGNIQSTLAADSVIAGQPVQVAVAGGVATLTGYVSNDAQRAVAARDAAGVAGVAKVVNDISVGTPPPASATATVPPPPMPAPTPARKTTQLLKPEPRHQPAPIERQQADNTPPPQPQPAPQPTPTPIPAPEPPPPPPPPPPTYKTVTVASGNTIPVRITQTLDSATTQADTTFSGVVASDIVIDGVVAIPAGSNVTGHVDAVQEAAHFKGSSLLTVSLTGITRRGEHLAVTTDPYTVTGKGRGANTAEKTGGGAAVGAILGGIFGGGKGAAIGAAAGGGVGAGSQAVTRGQQVQIESETIVRFHLSSPVSVKVRTDAGEHHGDDGALQPRSN